MNPLTHTLFCCALLCLTMKELTEACSCTLFHPQQQFCSAAIVLRVKVTAVETVGLTTQYTIEVIETFKGSNTPAITSVYTASDSAACGVTLEIGNEYLLGGFVQDGKVRISSCGLVSPWASVSAFQAEMLSKPDIGYQKGCECKIKYCTLETCTKPEKDECFWFDTEDVEHACTKMENGSCGWYPSAPTKS